MPTSFEVVSPADVGAVFADRVDGWVSDAIGIGQACSFRSVLAYVPGVWPPDVLASLGRLSSRGVVPLEFLSQCENEVCQNSDPAPSSRTDKELNMQLEHPLDYEWHFTHAGRSRIFDEVHKLHPSSPLVILCLGCPSIFNHGQSAVPHANFVLWDKNVPALGQMSEAHSLCEVDLRRSELPSTVADIAIVDPPWYNGFYKLFLWAALRSVRVGAEILLSFPPPGTRPSAVNDLAEVLAWTKSAGATLVEHHPHCLPYRSPLFEVNALRATGIRAFPMDWRRGDLLVLRKVASCELDRPLNLDVQDTWHEQRVGPVRFKFRLHDELSGAARLEPVGQDAVLPSVSSHFPGREKANVVTSGNRFFRTSSPALAAKLFESFSPATQIGRDSAELLPRSAEQLRQQLNGIVAMELTEASEYFSRVHDWRA